MARQPKAMGSRNNHQPEALRTEDAVSKSMANMDDVSEFMTKDQRTITMVAAKDIHKTYNARFVPCSFDDFSQINWPAYETPAEELDQALADCLSDAGWYTSLPADQKLEFIEFMGVIHTDSKNIAENVQLVPIILERDGRNGELLLVDGERRVLCSLYSLNKNAGQRILRLKALVYNQLLSPLARAVVKEWSNRSLKLKPHEQLDGWSHIFDAYIEENGKAPPSREFARIAGTNRDQAGYAVKLFSQDNRKELFRTIRRERYGWRDVKDLLRLNEQKNEVPSRKQKKGPAKKQQEHSELHSGFMRSVQGKFGSKSQVKFSKTAVTLTVPLEKLKELESLINE